MSLIFFLSAFEYSDNHIFTELNFFKRNKTSILSKDGLIEKFGMAILPYTKSRQTLKLD